MRNPSPSLAATAILLVLNLLPFPSVEATPSTDPAQETRLIGGEGGEVGVWQFDPDDLNVPSTGYTRDASGHGLHAMIGSSTGSDAQDPASQPTGGAPGYSGTTGSGYVSFNHGQYLQVRPASALDVARITVAAWISVDPTNNLHSTWEDLVSKAGGADGFYTAVYTDSSDRQFLAAFIYGVGSDSWLISSTPLQENGWVAVALTFDGSSMVLYAAGQEVARRSGLTGSIQSNTYPVTIGASPRDSRYFYGSMDEVRIYPRALGATEIQDVMSYPYGSGGSSGGCSAQAADGATKALWHFDGSAPTTDSSGNGNTLTLNGGASSSNNVLSLSGSGQYASTSDSASLSQLDALTVEACIHPTALSGGIAAQSGGSGGWQGSWYLSLVPDGSNAKIRFWLSGDGYTDGGVDTAAAPISASGTYRVKAVYTGSTQTAQIYVDDQLHTVTEPWSAGIPTRLYDSPQPVDVGTIRNSGNAMGPFFAGTIDEVKISGSTSSPPANRNPNAPSNGAPTGTGVSTGPTLTWTNNGDLDGDATYTTVYLDAASNPTTQRCARAAAYTSCPVSGLPYSTTYYWKVVVDDNKGGSSSATWSFTTAAPPSAACPALTAEPETRALWHFNAGNPTADSSGNGNGLILFGGPDTSGNALVLAGGTQHAEALDSVSLSQRDSLTVEACIRPESTAGGGGIAGQSGGPSGWAAAWYFTLLDSSRLRFWVTGDGSTDSGVETIDPSQAPGNTKIVAGATYQVKAMYDGRSRSALIFINGVQQATTMPWAGIPSRLFDSSQRVDIGVVRNSNNVLGPYFKGMIDEVRIGRLPDTDGDGLSDYLESTSYPNRAATFCGSMCAWPNPTVKDLYVEVDWMVMPGGYGGPMKPSEGQLKAVADAFAAKGILAHFDTGQYGGGNALPTYTHTLPFAPDPSEVDFYDYKRGGNGIPAQFDVDNRYHVWHYMIFGFNYEEDKTSSGTARVGDDDSFISYGLIQKNQGWPGFDYSNFDTAIAGTIIHELGHTLCLAGSQWSGQSAACVYAEIDTKGSTTYRSSMNYRYQMKMVDYSSGANLPQKDHDDWTPVLGEGIDDFVNSERGDEGQSQGSPGNPLPLLDPAEIVRGINLEEATAMFLGQ